MYCEHCGKLIEEKAKFCPHCGQAKTSIKPINTESTTTHPKKKSNVLGAIVGILVVLIVGSIVKYAVSGALNWNSTSSQAGNKYPEENRNAFLQSCIDSAGGQSYKTYCNCGLEYLESHYSFNEFTNLENEYTKTNKLPQGINDAMSGCAK